MIRSAAIMQPYIFPYIGYLHLIEAATDFVFYDDVQYIKRGWINRNSILNNSDRLRFTVPVRKPLIRKLICEVSPSIDEKWVDSFYKTLRHSYSKAPCFADAIDPIMDVFNGPHKTIADVAINSIRTVYAYLSKQRSFLRSSLSFSKSRNLGRTKRLIEITKQLGANRYINAPGGRHLYDANEFENEGLELRFIESEPIRYPQKENAFVPSLSIIDAMMFNPPSELEGLLTKFTVQT